MQLTHCKAPLHPALVLPISPRDGYILPTVSFEVTYNVSVDPFAMEVCQPVSSGYTRRSSSSDDHVQKSHCPPAAVQSATSYSKIIKH